MDVTGDVALAQIYEELRAIREREDERKTYDLTDDSRRGGSRYAGPNADRSLVESLASGDAVRKAETTIARGETGEKSLAGWLADTKALAEGTPSSGGYLVPPQLSAQIVTALRARSAVMAMGPTVVPVGKELDVGAISSGAAAYWVAENAAIP